MSDEESKAHAASKAGPQAGKTLFERIISREIPADIFYEDDLVYAIPFIYADSLTGLNFYFQSLGSCF